MSALNAATEDSVSRVPPLRRAVGWVRPVYDVAFGDPIKEGRLRLSGVATSERSAAIVGVTAVVLLLASVVFSDLWRRGELFFLNAVGDRLEFLPVAILPVTLIGLTLAWALMLWGALNASSWVRLALAAVFLFANAAIGRPLTTELGEGFQLGPLLARVGYFGAPGALVLYTVLALLRRREVVWAKRVALFLGVVFCGLLFGGQLVSHVDQVQSGIDPTVPFLLHGAVGTIDRLLIPLALIAGVAVVEFSYDIAQASIVSAWRVPASIARNLLVALIGLKLWIQVARHWSEWVDYLSNRPFAVVGPLVMLGVLLLARQAFEARRQAFAGDEEVKERLLYGTAILMAVPALLVLLVITFGEFLIMQFNLLEAQRYVIDPIPVDWLFNWGEVLLWGAALLVGTWWVRRPGSGRRSIGIGLVLFAGWIFPFVALELVDVEPSLRVTLVDLLITVGVGAYLAARWSRIDSRSAVALAGLIIFAWLINTEGDFIAIIAGLVGLSDIVVLVFGVVFTLLADSSFAAEGSKHFPRSARLLLWVGYLVLSMTLVNWLQATHGSDLAGRMAARGFFYLGIPLGAWLILARGFNPPEAAESTA